MDTNKLRSLEPIIKRRLLIDKRALASFRISVGILVAVDLLLRIRNLRYFYTQEGVLPRQAADALLSGWRFSFHLLLPDSSTVVWLLFGLHFFFALQLILGYRTKLATAVVFLFTVSLNARNVLVLSYSDHILMLLLFWGIFLPLGDRWSIDSVVFGESTASGITNVLFGISSALVLIQVVSIYFVNWVQKSSVKAWRTGDIMITLANGDEITFLLGNFLSELPAVALQSSGLFWYYLLLLSPLLILASGRYRIPVVALFIFSHVVIALTFRVGEFSFVMISSLLLFIPTHVWESFEHIVSSVVPSKLYADEAELERILSRKDGLRDAAVLFAIVVVSVSGVYMVSANAQTVSQNTGVIESIEDNPFGPVEEVKKNFLIHQRNWTIIKDVRAIDNYFIFSAETNTGKKVDVYNDRGLSYDRPYRNLNKQYDTYRERFYMGRLLVNRDPTNVGIIGTGLAEYLCRTWESPSGSRLDHLSMYAVTEEETTERQGGNHKNKIATSLMYHGCGGENAPKIIQPPPEDYSLDAGFSPTSVDANLTIPGLSAVEGIKEDLSLSESEGTIESTCVEGPEPFDHRRVSEYVEVSEVNNHLKFGRSVQSLSIVPIQKTRYKNAFALQYRLGVHTSGVPRETPYIYDVEYILTRDYSYRNVPPAYRYISPEYAASKSGFVDCFK
jgi:hypothetical protein